MRQNASYYIRLQLDAAISVLITDIDTGLFILTGNHKAFCRQIRNGITLSLSRRDLLDDEALNLRREVKALEQMVQDASDNSATE